MPNNDRDDEVDPLAEEDEVVDAAEDEDEFEDDDEEEDLEDEGDVEPRGALTHEVGSEGGSPGEDVELFRATGGNTRGSEASETMPGGTRARTVERRGDDDRRIKRVP